MKSFDVSDFSIRENDRDVLGRGSYAMVRRCKHKSLGTVVIKCFTLTGSNAAIKKRYDHIENEARVLFRLQHENIIKMFGVTRWSNYYGVVMEEAKQNLEDVFIHETDEFISWTLRLRCCFEIAKGMRYLHYHDSKRSYIHGDLKLQNILLTENLIVKIADFGAVSLLQATGCSIGSIDILPSNQHTWLYAAPEVLNNPNMNRTRAMDVYSYALIVYEIITRSQVFVSSGQVSLRLIMEMIKENGQKPDKRLIDNVKEKLTDKDDLEIWEELKGIVIKCWDTDPVNRLDIRYVENKLKVLNAKFPEIESKHSPDNQPSSKVKLKDQTILVPLQDVKCVLVGDVDSGKAELMSDFIHGECSTSSAVSNVHRKTITVDGNSVTLCMFDTSGQEDYSMLRPISYSYTDVFLVCFSIVSPDSFANISKMWIPELKKYSPQTPIILVGTNCNLRDDEKIVAEFKKTGKIPVSNEKGLQLVKDVKATKYLECSTIAHESVDKVFEEAIRVVMHVHVNQFKLDKSKICNII